MKLMFKLQMFTFALLGVLWIPFVRVNTAERKKRVFVVPQLTRIGDLVVASSVFRGIKEQNPETHVAVLVATQAKEMVMYNPYIDEVIIFEDYKRNLIGLIRDIRKRGFGIGVSLSGSPLSNMLFLGGGIPVRAKITRSPRPIMEILTDWMVPIKEHFQKHTSLFNAFQGVLSKVGISAIEDVREVFGAPGGRERVSQYLTMGQGPRIVLFPTTGNPVKEWGDDKFAELGKRLKGDYPTVSLFIAGAPKDKARLSALAKSTGAVPIFDVGMGDLSLLLQEMDLVIGGDTGPLHIAHAVGTPAVDIIGPVSDKELTPQSQKFQVVYPPEYEPAIFAMHPQGDDQTIREAFEDTTVFSVFSAVQSILQA